MPSIALHVQQILDLASEYSRVATPAMERRTSIAEDLADEVASAIASLERTDSTVGLNLQVKAGGRQSSYSPLPWIRIYSPTYSPTAQAGIYLCYLFAADGSRAYLSLNQGTSEMRSGHMRSIDNAKVLLSRAGQARSALGDLIEAECAAGALESIDLSSASLTSRESRIRGQAYERANILARKYVSGSVPPDVQLLGDLSRMLPLLAQLYGEVFKLREAEPPADSDSRGAVGQRSRTGTRQGPVSDPIIRKMLELWAEDHAISHFESMDFVVERKGHLKLGYDLECTNEDGRVIHVEVKGTQTRGEKVIVSDNEVRHVREADKCGAEHAFYVVSDIDVSAEGPTACSGGKDLCRWPWAINDDDLAPIDYYYVVPRD